jgi:hypothetical protein
MLGTNPIIKGKNTKITTSSKQLEAQEDHYQLRMMMKKKT